MKVEVLYIAGARLRGSLLKSRPGLVKKKLRNKLSRVGAAAAYADAAATYADAAAAYADAAAAYADAAAAYADAAAAYARTTKIKTNSLELSLQAVNVLSI